METDYMTRYITDTYGCIVLYSFPILSKMETRSTGYMCREQHSTRFICLEHRIMGGTDEIVEHDEKSILALIYDYTTAIKDLRKVSLIIKGNI